MRNSGQKLRGERFHTGIEKYFFTDRVIENWNKLLAIVINAKKRVDDHFLSVCYH